MAKRKKRNGVEFRADRNRWGYRFSHRGKCYKKFAWETREEAKAALIERKRELASQPKEPELPPTALITVVGSYLIDSAEKGRSQWRIDGMRWNFNKVIIPFFGAATPIASITTEQIQKLVVQRKRQVRPKTLWHDVTNLRSCLNWAIEKKLLKENPVDNLDMSIIGSTKSKKAPLNLAAVDKAAEVLNSRPVDRAYFDFLRFTELRKDEANRLKWDDIDFANGSFHCRGTKTDEADSYLPLADILVESLKRLKLTSTSEYVFAGTSPQTKGKKIYSRRRMFERIKRITGIALKPKDLRDYFASTVQTDDPRTLMKLMRHTNLTTTTKYLLAEQDRMKEAVKNLGATLGASQNTPRGQKTAQNDMLAKLAQLLISGGSIETLMGNFGGGGRSRTADAADMSRVL